MLAHLGITGITARFTAMPAINKYNRWVAGWLVESLAGWATSVPLPFPLPLAAVGQGLPACCLPESDSAPGAGPAPQVVLPSATGVTEGHTTHIPTGQSRRLRHLWALKTLSLSVLISSPVGVLYPAM